MPNEPLHTEPRAARLGATKIVRRSPVNGGVETVEIPSSRASAPIRSDRPQWVERVSSALRQAVARSRRRRLTLPATPVERWQCAVQTTLKVHAPISRSGRRGVLARTTHLSPLSRGAGFHVILEVAAFRPVLADQRQQSAVQTRLPRFSSGPSPGCRGVAVARGVRLSDG